MSKIKASILVNTYNHEKYINECLASCLKQDFPSEEYQVIVVDDGSTDDTLTRLKKYEGKIQIFSKSNSGQSHSINTGIEKSKGEILLFLDGDDFIHKSRVNNIVENFDKDPDLGIILNNREVVFEDEAYKYKSIYLKNDFNYSHLKLSPSTKNFIKALNHSYITSTISIKKSAIKKIFPLPVKGKFCSDLFLMSACLYSSFLFINSNLTFYRYHNNNLFLSDKKDVKEVIRAKKIFWDEIIKRSKTKGEDYDILTKRKKIELKDLYLDFLAIKKKVSRIQYILFKQRFQKLSIKSILVVLVFGPYNALKIKESYLKYKYSFFNKQ